MEVHSSSMQHKRVASLEWAANAEQIMVNRARKAEELAAALAANKGHPTQTDNEESGQSSQAGFGAGPREQYAPTYVS